MRIIIFILYYSTIICLCIATSRWYTIEDEISLANLMDSPNTTTPSLFCPKIQGLGEKYKKWCYRSPAALLAIGEANKRTLEHMEKVFQEDELPGNIMIYKSIFSFRIAEGSKREIVYLASIRTSAIAHELAVTCSDGLAEDACPCYRPPPDTDHELKSALGTPPLVLDQGCPYALAHAQRLALDYILNDQEILPEVRLMIKDHAIAAVKSIEAGWVDPEEEWERKLREFEENSAKLNGKQVNGFGATLHGHGEL